MHWTVKRSIWQKCRKMENKTKELRGSGGKTKRQRVKEGENVEGERERMV